MKVFSMFSGIGGFDLAFKNQGHEVIGACEIDRYARQIYSRHFPGVTIHNDATTMQPESLPQFDLLCGGFPCQAFSPAGKRRGFDDCRGTLFFEIARIAKEKRPRYLLLENVRGLLSHNKGETFRIILSTLDEMGYDAEWQVINSKYFVPQNRERIFIIGHLRGESTRQIFPLGDCDKINNRARQEAQGEGERISCPYSTSLQTTPNKGTSTYISNTIDANYHKGGSRTMIYLSQKNSNMKQRTQDRTESWTLTYNGSDFGIKQDKIRRLTPLECERLQGFPDGWTEGISDTQRYKCLGNAVTVPVIEYIIKKF